MTPGIRVPWKPVEAQTKEKKLTPQPHYSYHKNIIRIDGKKYSLHSYAETFKGSPYSGPTISRNQSELDVYGLANI